MRLVVCLKAVPASTEVAMDPVTHTIVRDGGDAVWNPYDTAALEVALRLKDEARAAGQEGWVGVVSMGIPATASLLEDALSRGADEALLLSDRAFAGSDTIATCYALTLGIGRLCAEPDLILCGKMAVDGDTAQIGPMLAAALRLPVVTGATTVERHGAAVDVEQVFDGARRRLCMHGPGVVTVDKDAATLRMPSIEGVLAARRTSVPVATAADLGADLDRCGLAGSPTQVVSCFVPERASDAVAIEGTPAEQAATLAYLMGEVLA
ncbi:electron transfer flavoprotein subunit beta/FixA family protein [Olsenella sp. YH-ols2217]|uniref:Electron transfer flavoprotein small subunit n=1 Tax=Kribbibacterium absianum TaxID=3044210 RepID=A0ABT6ZM05_9ACTN|nr:MULTISPECIES: electron transfer flavoprotein subunit beta/FixA family protein [unclassified Olsenella]MDJ1121678.1 electron transfer flavoprotein subunit beta/FixA family protein [Olsenella sp. YH-ols2216]MDJ1129686.1 electron transfer flavoprotein subunit beta/FixA family protein [Olsenella sp. YH-ols2217]